MDSYGMAKYQEVNPGLFAIVTFPFLFAVMFGDIGHGLIILSAAIYMILNERRLARSDLGEVSFVRFFFLRFVAEITPIFVDQRPVLFVRPSSSCPAAFADNKFSGRYIILLMGLFSIYTGLMYNDIFSKSLHIWHSGWTFTEANGLITGESNGHTYPFGVDPGWHGADNGLLFTNSYKMKMSIVLGVIHVRLFLFILHFWLTLSS